MNSSGDGDISLREALGYRAMRLVHRGASRWKNGEDMFLMLGPAVVLWTLKRKGV